MRIEVCGRSFEYSVVQFSGGELHPRLCEPDRFKQCATGEVVQIRADLRSSEGILELMLVTDMVRRAAPVLHALRLVCPYMPYARQDRIAYPGEALGARVMCDAINALRFDAVQIWDAHSDVVPALLDNVENVHQKDLVFGISDSVIRNCVLVAPDAGATKKTMAVAAHLGLPFVQAEKTRSTEDGSITGTKVHAGHIGNRDFLIVDDICDGGRTFIELAKELRPLTTGKIRLYVTHGIFSKGLSVFDGLIDDVYTPNPWPTVDKDDPKLVIL